MLLVALNTQVKNNSLQSGLLTRTRPLNFEMNREQAAPNARFLLQNSRYKLLLSERNAMLSFPQQSTRSSLQMAFIDARTPGAITGDNSLPGVVNDLIGNDPKR